MRLRIILAVALAAVALAAVQGATPAADPLVGRWSYGAGLIDVSRTSSGYLGVVVDDVRFAQCPHVAGERIWTISRDASGYSGRHLSFAPVPGCGRRVSLNAVWQLSGGRLDVRIARFKGRRVGACGADTVCFKLTRVVRPEPRALSLDLLGPPEWGEWTLASSYRASAITADGSFTLIQGRVSGLGGTVTVAHDNGDEPETVIELKLAGAFGFGREGRSQLLRARVSVVSGGAGCDEGETGTVWLKDAPGGDLFALRVCGERLQFRNGVGGARVKISLG